MYVHNNTYYLGARGSLMMYIKYKIVTRIYIFDNLSSPNNLTSPTNRGSLTPPRLGQRPHIPSLFQHYCSFP